MLKRDYETQPSLLIFSLEFLLTLRTVSLQWKRHFDGDLPFWLSSVEVPGCQMAFELSFFRWHLQSHQWHSSWNWLTTFFSKSQLWGDWRDFFYRSLSYVEGFFFPQSVLPDIFIRCSSTWAHEIWVVTVHNNSKSEGSKGQKTWSHTWVIPMFHLHLELWTSTISRISLPEVTSIKVTWTSF